MNVKSIVELEAEFGESILRFMTPPVFGAKQVWSRGGKTRGKIVGKGRRCQLEGCSGWRVSVRWSDGKLTLPCTKGMFERKDGDLQIE